MSGVVDTITDVGVNRTITILVGSGITEEQLAEEAGEEQDSEETAEGEDGNANAAEPECGANELLVFPNPSDTGGYTFCTDFDEGPYTIDIFDLKGRKVAGYTITATEPTLNLSNLESGLYLVRFAGNNKVFFKKLLRR